MQPISEKNKNLHKGPSKSRDFNKMMNDVHHDLTRLFDTANLHEEEIKENMDILIRENLFLQNKLIQLEDFASTLEYNLQSNINDEERHRLSQSFYTRENIITNHDSPSYIDTLYGYASIQDSDRISKTSQVLDNGQVLMPDDLQVNILESNDTREVEDETGMREHYVVEDQNALKMFDKDPSSYWVRKVTFPDDKNVNEVSGILHIKLPLGMVNNVTCNTLVMNPYPEYSMTIEDVQYKGYGEQWHRLPNYPAKEVDGQEVPVPIHTAGKQIFAFPSTEITEIQIHFTQPYWLYQKGEREFVYGFQAIDIEQRVYQHEETSFTTAFSLEGTTRRFQRIYYPSFDISEGSFENIDDLVQHQLFYSKDLTSEFQFGQEIMAPIQKVYVKTTLRASSDTIPMLKNVKIDCQVRETNL